MMDWVVHSGWLLPSLAAWLMGGAALGVIYFRCLRLSAEMMVSGARPGRGLMLVLVRVAGLGGVLIVAAMQGALPLLAAAVGIMIGRRAVMRQTAGPA